MNWDKVFDQLPTGGPGDYVEKETEIQMSDQGTTSQQAGMVNAAAPVGSRPPEIRQKIEQVFGAASNQASLLKMLEERLDPIRRHQPVNAEDQGKAAMQTEFGGQLHNTLEILDRNNHIIHELLDSLEI